MTFDRQSNARRMAQIWWKFIGNIWSFGQKVVYFFSGHAAVPKGHKTPTSAELLCSVVTLHARHLLSFLSARWNKLQTFAAVLHGPAFGVLHFHPLSWYYIFRSCIFQSCIFSYPAVERSDSGKIRFDSIHADESIFRFYSIRQFDKTDSCTLIVT